VSSQSLSKTLRKIAGRYFPVTGSGKYFRNIEVDPEANLAALSHVFESNSVNVTRGKVRRNARSCSPKASVPWVDIGGWPMARGDARMFPSRAKAGKIKSRQPTRAPRQSFSCPRGNL
jgi:hypothetical protein